MYCNLLQPDAMPLLTKMFWGPRNTSDPISMIAFTFSMRRHLIRFASAPFISFSLAVWLGSVCWPCTTPGNEAERRIYRGWVKFRSYFSCLWTKVHEIWDNVGDPSSFLMSLPDCLWRVSFRTHLPLSLEVVEKPNKCKSFLAFNFWQVWLSST